MCPFLEKLLGQKNKKDQVRRKEGIQRELTLILKVKDIDSVQSKFNKGLYTVPMNINGYVPFLINMFNTDVRGG